MSRTEFKFKVFNAQYNGYILSFSADSTWIWVGERDVNSLGLAHFPLFSMLFDADNAQREFHKAATLRLAKQLAVTQVFFSSDIENEDALFWQELHKVLLPILKDALVEIKDKSS